MEKNFERTLPEGYKEIYHLDAKDTKTGLIMTAFSVIPLLILMPIAIALVVVNGLIDEFNLIFFNGVLMTGLIIMIIYMVLHELVHGITYKLLTHEKLTFGISWSCAYCGVPSIYVYRKTALLALIMPFAVFSLIFIPLTIALYFINTFFFLAFTFVLSMHLGGCCGDLYVTYLFLFKMKDSKTLMRDTGPEQFFYSLE